MLVQDLVSLSMRTSGILGVGQTPLAQDLTDVQNLLQMLMQQWRQKRWLVFRLAYILFPLVTGKPSYTVGPVIQPGNAPPPPETGPPDVEVNANFRPANIQSCYLRQNLGSGPNSFPVDFPMHVMGSRQEYDAIRLKTLQSWPAAIYYDPIIPYAQLIVWPIPVQPLFSLYIAYQEAIDVAVESSQATELDDYLPTETQLAMMYSLALLCETSWKLPPDPNLAAAARAAVNTLRMTNYAMQPLTMPRGLAARPRWRNPMGGFYPEIAAGVPVTTLG